jgi:hypothetical protein
LKRLDTLEAASADLFAAAEGAELLLEAANAGYTSAANRTPLAMAPVDLMNGSRSFAAARFAGELAVIYIPFVLAQSRSGSR